MENDKAYELISKILQNDKEAFDEFHEETYKMVRVQCGKYIKLVNFVTKGLYDFDDLYNEMWYFIIIGLHNYNKNKGSISTWIYKVCNSAAMRVMQHWETKGRESNNISYNTRTQLDNGEGDTELIDFIPDKGLPLMDYIEGELSVYDYVYILKLLVSKLNDKKRTVFMHELMGMTLDQSGSIIGITKERIRQIRVDVDKKLKALLFLYNNGRLDVKESANFAIPLLSDLADDEIVLKYNYDLATIKICRLALQYAELD